MQRPFTLGSKCGALAHPVSQGDALGEPPASVPRKEISDVVFCCNLDSIFYIRNTLNN